MKQKYYEEKLEKISESGEFDEMKLDGVPLIAADFNGWRYETMKEVVPFCMENDLDAPNFVEMCIAEGVLKNARPEALLPG